RFSRDWSSDVCSSDLARVRWEVAGSPGVAAADAPGRVTITLTDGREVTGSVPRSEGGGDRPLSRASLLAKFKGNAGVPAAEAEEIGRASGSARAARRG